MGRCRGAGQLVDRRLDGEDRLAQPVAAERPGRQGVRVDRVALDPLVRAVVGGQALVAAMVQHAAGMIAVGAGIREHAERDRGEAAVGPRPDLHPHAHRMRVVAEQKFSSRVSSRTSPADRSVSTARRRDPRSAFPACRRSRRRPGRRAPAPVPVEIEQRAERVAGEEGTCVEERRVSRPSASSQPKGRGSRDARAARAGTRTRPRGRGGPAQSPPRHRRCAPCASAARFGWGQERRRSSPPALSPSRPVGSRSADREPAARGFQRHPRVEQRRTHRVGDPQRPHAPPSPRPRSRPRPPRRAGPGSGSPDRAAPCPPRRRGGSRDAPSRSGARRSSWVSTATTPGTARAAARSMCRIRAWAWGARSTFRCSRPGIVQSKV